MILAVHSGQAWQAVAHGKREIGAEWKVGGNLGGFCCVLVFLNIFVSQEDTSPLPQAEEYRNTNKLSSYLLKHQPRAETHMGPTPSDSGGPHGNYVQHIPKMSR